ncbi:hypothetical protein FQN54_006534 [Arachnomyces sp. PD_36]|nr:hypothetical protein FQN54_006534 [Arachnomyces sp. PD_36]
MSSEIHIRPRSRRDTIATVTTVSSLPPPIPPEYQQQQQQQQHGPRPPSPAHLCASPWTVNYSTLPMWRNKRNVKITYSSLSKNPYKNNPPTKHHRHVEKEASKIEEIHLSDLVTYQSLTSKRIHSVKGIDKPTPPPSQPPSPSQSPQKPRLHSLLACSPRQKRPPTPNAWTYTWRGSTYLKPFTSNWEVLGYGSVSVEGVKHDWLLSYFSKTRVTPAGVDILFRRSSSSINPEEVEEDGACMGEPPEQLVSAIRQKLQTSEDETLKKLGDGIFRVKVD